MSPSQSQSQSQSQCPSPSQGAGARPVASSRRSVPGSEPHVPIFLNSGQREEQRT